MVGFPSFEGMGEKFRVYIFLQGAWWVGSYAVCYHCSPTILLMQTSAGRRAAHGLGAWLQRVWPSRYESIAKTSERAYGSTNGRAFGEFLLINKVLSPVMFPVLIATADKIVEQRRHVIEAAGFVTIRLPTVHSDPAGLPTEQLRGGSAEVDCGDGMGLSAGLHAESQCLAPGLHGNSR